MGLASADRFTDGEGMKAEVPQGRLGRAWGLGRLGARLAVLRASSSDAGALHRDLAGTIAAELGRMKGLPMKVGQILTYLTGVLPEAHRETWREALRPLQAHSAAVDPKACRWVLEAELKAPVGEVFERFDPEPVASASIGQVFFGHWKGRPVAIKVQYPGIAQAIADDLANMDGLAALLRPVLPTLDIASVLGELRDRLLEECDYRREAENQRRFGALLESEPDVIIPAVLDELCTERVLVTEWVEGHVLDRFLELSAPADRYRAGEALFRCSFGPMLEGWVHADPHPGNFLFLEGGRIAVLDFGCVQPLDSASRAGLFTLLEAAVRGEPLMPVWAEALGLHAVDAATLGRIDAMGARFLAPITEPQPYTFRSAYTDAVAREVLNEKAALGARFLTRRGRLEFERPGMMLVVRTLFGLAHIWGSLGASGPFRQITADLLARARDAK